MEKNNSVNQNLIIHKDDKNIIICIIIKSNYNGEGISFFTPSDFSQQLAYMNRPKGYKIKPHYHKRNKRIVNFTQEVLLVKKGIIKVKLFDNNKNFMIDVVIENGDVILLASGGHSFEFLSNSELIEVKQGPYKTEDDKVIFSE